MTAVPARTPSPGRSTRPGRLFLVALGLLLVALALGVRLWGLTERGVWLDETVSLRVAAQPLPEIARGEVFDNHTPPLYYLLLHLWFLVVPEGLGTLRLLSVLTDLACLAVLAVAVRRVWGGAVALGVGAAYAAAPFAVRLAQEGRMYPLLMLLVVGCFALALELDRRRDRTWPAAALAPVAAAALYTHYYAALSLLALHGVMAWRLRRDRPARRRWWGAMAAAFVLFVPWLPVVAELLAGGGQFFRAFGPAVVPYAFLRFVVGFSLLPTDVGGKLDLGATILEHLPILGAAALGTGTVLLLAVRRVVRREGPGPARSGVPQSVEVQSVEVQSGDEHSGQGWSAERRSGEMPAGRPPSRPVAGRLLLALVAVPPLLALAVTTVAPSLDERYLAVCFPFFLVLAVLGAAEGLDSLRGALRRGAPLRGGAVWRLAAVALTTALIVAGAVRQLADPDAGTTPWREAAAELVRHQPEGGRVLVRPPYYAPVLAANLAAAGVAVEVAGGLPGEGTGGGEPRSAEAAWTVAGAGFHPTSASTGAGSAPGPAAGPAWLVEVAFLVRHGPAVPDPASNRREHRLLPAGNGLRLLRLGPTGGAAGGESPLEGGSEPVHRRPP